MTRSLLAVAVLALALPAGAQPPSVEPPSVGQPPNFSKVVGKYTIAVSAEPREVAVGDPITLRLRIRGVGPEKYRPRRGNLRILPDWGDDFYVENVPDEDRVIKDENAWIFVYRLRPKHVNVKEIDGLELVYYDPEYRGKNKFVSPPIDAIPIVVQPQADESRDIKTPVVLPASFYQYGKMSNVAWSPSGMAWPAWLIAVLTLGPLLVCVVGALAWRRWFPSDDVRRTQRRRRAAREASVHLDAGVLPWEVVHRYLRERFEFPGDEPTPGDVSSFLKKRGFALERCQAAAAFLARCDAVRFADYLGANAHSLRDDAVRLIDSLEADPCAR